VIFNPASGRGRGAKRLSTYRALLDEHLGEYAHASTEAAGDEYVLADRAMDDGHDLIVAVGGDGTWSHVADRVVSRVASEGADVALGVLPAGTGNDFGRNLELSFSDPAAAVKALAAGRERRVDIGFVRTPSSPDGGDESPRARHFLNVIGIGFDVAVIDAAADARFLKGELLYKVTALQQLFRFPGALLKASDHAGFEREATHLMVTISNGRWFGGGFPIAPDGRIDDGMLHACLIGDASPLQRLKLFGLAEKGRHVGDPRVELRSAGRFSLEFGAPIRFEVDGDVFRTEGTTLELEVRPGALTLVGA
jgi:diacylglycerol kinase (ATP)